MNSMATLLRDQFSRMRENDIEPKRVMVPRSAFESLMAELGPVILARRDPKEGILPIFDGVEIQVLEGR